MMMCWCCWHEKNKSIVEACDSHRLESLQGLQHSTVLVKADVPVSPRPQHPSRTSPWAVFGGFPMLLIMCAAGDGSHAMLILLSSSGKYPASLRRTKTTKNWVWLQPPGFCAPTRTCPRVTACCFLLTIYPCPTLLPHTIFLWPSIKPMKDSYVFILTYSIPLFHPRDYNSSYIRDFRSYKGVKWKRHVWVPEMSPTEPDDRWSSLRRSVDTCGSILLNLLFLHPLGVATSDHLPPTVQYYSILLVQNIPTNNNIQWQLNNAHSVYS